MVKGRKFLWRCSLGRSGVGGTSRLWRGLDVTSALVCRELWLPPSSPSAGVNERKGERRGGVAFARFVCIEDGDRCIAAMDGQSIEGGSRGLQVRYANRGGRMSAHQASAALALDGSAMGAVDYSETDRIGVAVDRGAARGRDALSGNGNQQSTHTTAEIQGFFRLKLAVDVFSDKAQHPFDIRLAGLEESFARFFVEILRPILFPGNHSKIRALFPIIIPVLIRGIRFEQS